MHVDFLRVVSIWVFICAHNMGKVMTWGHGQLGHGDFTNVKVPKAVKALGDHKVTFIAPGVIGKRSLSYIRFFKNSYRFCANGEIVLKSSVLYSRISI